MSAKDRTPITRLIALAALLLAAGLLALRAYDQFGGVASEPIGSTVEQELTYLLEPIVGADNVRVSLSGRTERTVLVMVNGDIGSDLRATRTQVESVLNAAIGFDAEKDVLSLTQFPFARGVGNSLTAFEVLELSGLTLMCALLFSQLFGAQPVHREDAPQPPVRRPEPSFAQIAHHAAPGRDPENEVSPAATLAEAKPNETARLVRGWMSYSED